MSFSAFSRSRQGGRPGVVVRIIGVSTDTPPVVTGTVVNPGGTISGLTVTVKLDGSTDGTTTTDGSGNWSYTLSGTPADGDHNVTASVPVTAVSNEDDFTVGAVTYGLRFYDYSDFRNLLGL